MLHAEKGERTLQLCEHVTDLRLKKLMWGITMNVPNHFARKYVGGMAEVLSMDLAKVLAESPQVAKDISASTVCDTPFQY